MNGELANSAYEKKYAYLETSYREFLQSVSLSSDANREIIGPKGYGRNNASLGFYIEARKAFIAAINHLFPKIHSTFLLEGMLFYLLGNLLEQHLKNSPLDVDSDTEIPSILEILNEVEISASATKLFEDLKAAMDLKLVIIPLMGVRIADSDLYLEIPFGECSLRPNSDWVLESLLEDSWSKLDEARREILSKADCLVTVKVAGDVDFVVKQAWERALPVVDILNFYLADCYKRADGWRKINLVGRSSTADDQLILVVRDIERTNLGSHWSIKEFQTYQIHSLHLSEWRSRGLESVLIAFSQDFRPTTINARIRRAITWYSKAVNADGLEEQFVGLVTALEGLLVGDEAGNPTASTASISQRLADRVAFLLEARYAERMAYIKSTKELYGLRSKIVHVGQTISFENLIHLNRIVIEVIHAFINLHLTTWEQFIEWENLQKYSAKFTDIGTDQSQVGAQN